MNITKSSTAGSGNNLANNLPRKIAALAKIKLGIKLNNGLRISRDFV
jgi:hypothetical protein